MDEERSTSLRITVKTKRAMRMAANQIGVRMGKFLPSDDERIMSLVDHWNATKGVAGVPHEEKLCG